MVIDLKEEYENACDISTDINEHLPILLELSKECDHITEMGVRDGQSTRAFLYANPKKYIAYDLYKNFEVDKLFEYCQSQGKDFHYILDNVLEIQIEETDFLFIDTYHTYDQLSKELELHASKVRKYIGFHDTVTYGNLGQDKNKGIIFAINEYLCKNNSIWRVKIDNKNNNGLIILEKIN